MTTGYYSVVRCVPDPARRETFNIGIAVWAKQLFRVAVDRAAARRAVSENPHLATHAFDNLEDIVNTQLLALDPINTTKFNKMRKNHRGTPFFFDEPQFVDVPNPQKELDPLGAALQKLLARLVFPRASQPIKKPDEEPDVIPAIVLELERKVRSLIDAGKVERKRLLHGTKSGKERHVDFLAGTTAIDAVQFEPKEEQAGIQDDGEAFKILDLMDGVHVRAYYVLPFTTRRTIQKTLAEDELNRSILSAGGQLLKSVDEAEQVLSAAG